MSHHDAVSQAAPGESGREPTLTYEPLLGFLENAPTTFPIAADVNVIIYAAEAPCLIFALFLAFQKKKQKELKESWARWTACLQGQPITAVRLRLRGITTLPFTVAIIAALLFFCCEVAAGVRRRCAHAGAI